jgi:two-component system, OmpR family, sensor kinase
VRKLSIRVRLTLPFALGMALMLAAVGIVIYLRVGSALLASVDQNLSAQAAEAVSHAHEGRTLLDRDVSDGPAIAEVELADGTIDDSSPATLPPLLDAAARRKVLAGGRAWRTTTIPGLRGEWRLLELPVRVDGHAAALVVGRSVAARAETLHRLAREFLFAAPAALLLAILAGYAVAAAALRPVEAMRRRASVISALTPGRRLPVPAARDEISALAVTLNEMLGRLEDALEHERRFVADASHELRTPLALLRAELELALRRPRSHAELEAAVRSAAGGTERLTRLAEDLLLIARSDQGAIPLRREPVEVVRLFEAVRDRFAPRAALLDREIEVDRSVDGDLDVDPLRLEQALGNLVDNALVHGRGTVRLRARERDGVIELHVRDEGRGFPASFLDRAFDRFSRADDARTTEGTGLGLSIVALIARAHGGEAQAENPPAGGADVWLTLPLRAGDAPLEQPDRPLSAGV